jgi:hypothetical protein
LESYFQFLDFVYFHNSDQQIFTQILYQFFILETRLGIGSVVREILNVDVFTEVLRFVVAILETELLVYEFFLLADFY